MALNINQFAQSTVQGQMDLLFNGSVISAQIDAAQSGSLVAGQPVKIATTAGGVPKVIALAADTDVTFGFIARNLKDSAFPASAPIELAQFGSVMWMTAGAAITRGASVEVVSATNKVITSAGTNPVVGYALDTAAANNDLIRVVIQAPYSAPATNLTNANRVITVTATLAELNAGKVLIAAAGSQAITVTDYIARINGSSFTTGTNIILESTNGTPVVVSTIAEAGLTSGSILTPGSANTTLGAGFGIAMGAGDGLKVVSTGTQAVGTSITFTITYKQA